jgi:uncharacterized glyoxalase superfamily protein PhnB
MAAKDRHSPAFEPGRATSTSLSNLNDAGPGGVIFYVTDVDALYERALAAGCQPATVPRDAEWGERFFHLVDPDGHELSFARPLLPTAVRPEFDKR